MRKINILLLTKEPVLLAGVNIWRSDGLRRRRPDWKLKERKPSES